MAEAGSSYRGRGYGRGGYGMRGGFMSRGGYQMYGMPYRGGRGMYLGRGSYMSRGRGYGPKRSGPGRRNDQDVGSKTVQIDTKKFYIDLKQNERGRFLSIAEVSATGQRRRMLVSVAAALEVTQLLSSFIDGYEELPSREGDGDPLKTEMLRRDGRRYFLDLKENKQGRFLKIAQTNSMGERIWVVIPAAGMQQFKEAFDELFKEFGDSDKAEGFEAKEDTEHAAVMRLESKKFFFDEGSNQRGNYLKVTEITQSLYYSGRALILIPSDSLLRFAETMQGLVDKCKGEDDTFEQQSNSLRVEHKTFYFDSGANRRGSFIRISEVQPNFRVSITVPGSQCKQFLETLQGFPKESKQNGDAVESSA